MARTACVDIRALPLQLLLREHPDWAGYPAVVVDVDKPQGVIQWSNSAALEMRILPGMRYAAALSINGDLRGAAIEEHAVQVARDEILETLWCFSPRVEPFEKEAGIFWLDASGLGYLFPSLQEWCDQMGRDLRGQGYRSVIAVGYSRFGSYAAAKASTTHVVLTSPAQERTRMRHVRIDRLGIDPQVRDTLNQLGIETLGEFGALRVEDVRVRLGAEAAEIHALLHESWEVLQPREIRDPVESELTFEWPERNAQRLLAAVVQLLPDILAQLKHYHESLDTLEIRLFQDDRTTETELIEPAEATMDVDVILRLVRLRFEALALRAGVERILLIGHGIEYGEGQLDLFTMRNWDARTINDVFARLRAELGNDAVVSGATNAGHLPEAQYAFARMETLRLPKSPEITMPGIVRRIYVPARELPGCERRDPDGWLIAGVSEGPVEEVIGPQLISGGWWLKEITRAYYFVRTRRGRWLWIYHDDRRKRWYLQGEAL